MPVRLVELRWQLRQRDVGKKGCCRHSRRSVLWQRGHASPVGWRCCSSHATHVASSSSSVIGKSIMFGSIPCTLRPHEPRYLAKQQSRQVRGESARPKEYVELRQHKTPRSQRGVLRGEICDIRASAPLINHRCSPKSILHCALQSQNSGDICAAKIFATRIPVQFACAMDAWRG